MDELEVGNKNCRLKTIFTNYFVWKRDSSLKNVYQLQNPKRQ